MFTVTFIVVAVFILLAIIFWGRGLVNLYRDGVKARGRLSTGFMIGLWGVVIAAILFGFFNL
jgi:hypothetical protein